VNETGSTAFADPELAELLDGEPELLAIADAISATALTRDGGRGSRASSPGTSPRRTRVLVAAAVLAAAVATAPALAFSTSLRGLVGLSTNGTSQPRFVARVTGVALHARRPRPGALVTVTFTVGERGKPPGTGIPPRSTFFVLLGGNPTHMVAARGRDGRYRATIRLAQSTIGGIEIGGFMPTKGPKVLNGGFWIPVLLDTPH
jgi:hypothetical protein